MDADMAMHLSLARGDPSYSPVPPFGSPVVTTSPFDASQVLGISTPLPAMQVDPDQFVLDDHDALSHTDHRFEHQDDVCHDLHPHPIDTSIVTTQERPPSLNFGLPSYQPNASQFNFDFSHMEDFAATEKVKLGFNADLSPKFVLGPTRRPKLHDVPPVSIPTSAIPDSPQQPDIIPDIQGGPRFPNQALQKSCVTVNSAKVIPNLEFNGGVLAVKWPFLKVVHKNHLSISLHVLVSQRVGKR